MKTHRAEVELATKSKRLNESGTPFSLDDMTLIRMLNSHVL